MKTILLLIALAVLATYSYAQDTESQLALQMDYLVREGGRWTAENPAYQTGTEAPTHFGYHYQWGAGNQYVKLAILGHFPEDETRTFWESMIAWHPVRQEIVLSQYGWDGTIGAGQTAVDEEGIHRVTIVFTRPDGTTFDYRDHDRKIDDDTFESHSYVKDAQGQWQEVQVLRWQRVTTG